MSWISGVVDLGGGPLAEDQKLDLLPSFPPADSIRRCFLPGVRLSCGGAIEGDGSQAVLAGRDGPVTVVADLRVDGLDGQDAAAWLLSAYERWGVALPEHLPGAFALTLWDASERRLLLARDAVGERVIYFRAQGPWLAFASEPAVLSRLGAQPARPHRPRLLSYLVGASPEPTWSFFSGVSRLPEGHRLVVSERGQELEAWHSPRRRSRVGLTAAQVAEELPRVLSRAVGRRLGPTGEQAVLLSGGLDSVTVAAEAARLLAESRRVLHAFTWSSATGDAIDERRLSSLLIDHQTNIVEHAVEADGLWPLSRFPAAYEDPNDPVSAAHPDLVWATLERARAAGVSVLLNGVGGDPAFGWSVPELALLLQGRLGALYRRGRVSGLVNLAKQPLRVLRRLWLPPWLTAAARGEIRLLELDRPPIPWQATCSARAFRQHLLSGPAQAIHLERFDRLSRRHRVRVTCPWHDLELAELALSSPDAGLAASLPLKPLVRRAFSGRLPAELLAAPTAKRGASRLRARGLLDLGRATVEGLLASSRLAELGLLEPAQILRNYRSGQSERGMIPRLFEVVTAEAWLSRLAM